MKKLFCLALILLFVNSPVWGAIDVGSAAIDRGSSTGAYNFIGKENPSNATGTINHLEIYQAFGYAIDIITFDQVDTNTFTAIGYAADLTLTTGYNELNAPGDFTAFDINLGSYIGIWCVASGTIERDLSGEGYWGVNTTSQKECEDKLFTWGADRTLSVYATGTTGAPPPAPKVQSQILILE